MVAVRFASHLTHKANLKQTRYGWLRLTPAYSLHLVGELLNAHASENHHVLDPFGGTGTTALVCAERGIPCDTIDINPFLVWLMRAKTQTYPIAVIREFRDGAHHIAQALHMPPERERWVPALHQIEKWWDEATLARLAAASAAIEAYQQGTDQRSIDLLHIAFCRVMIESSRASFAHQSMSFKKADDALVLPFDYPEHPLVTRWHAIVSELLVSATSPIRLKPRVFQGDARQIGTIVVGQQYDLVISSPPYPNRISYIRELRPYMYWMRYLTSGRQAGELDWQAIGGTWGCATSNLTRWQPESMEMSDRLAPLVQAIHQKSLILAYYVQRYFQDMQMHCASLHPVMRPGGTLYYIVGNSKFYETVLPVEHLYAEMLERAGFVDVNIQPIRKRSSKKELIEFLVSARKADEREQAPPIG